MRVARVVLLCLLVMGCSARARAGAVVLGPLDVWPPYAQVFLYTSSGPVNLGSANQRLSLPSGTSSIQIQIEASGFATYTTTILPSAPPPYGIPDHLYLVPSSLWSVVSSVWQVYPLRSLLVLGFPIVILWILLHQLAVLRGRLHRAEEVEKLLMAQHADQMVATRVGGYRIVSVLGEGGMAIVYEGCRDDTFPEGQRVAVKVIRTLHDDAIEYLLRFKREINICSKLNHPGIVRVLDFGDHHGRPYLVMELIRGETLQTASKRQPIDMKTFLDMFIAMLEALDYAHDQGVVHRDIKPNNIILTEQGRPVIMDFGIAHTDTGKYIRTQTGALLGTPIFMAPEQLESKPTTALADQYSMGLVGWQLLTGQLPIDGDNTYAMVAQKLIMDLPGPRTVRSDVPPELDAVLMRMLERRPTDRFPTLKDAIDKLQQLSNRYFSTRR